MARKRGGHSESSREMVAFRNLLLAKYQKEILRIILERQLFIKRRRHFFIVPGSNIESCAAMSRPKAL